MCQQNLCIPLCDMSSGNGWVPTPSGIGDDLRAVWGASASAVWAVGDNGSAVFYDGQRWQSFPIPPLRQMPLNMVAVHGSSPGNVFALGGTSTLIAVMQFLKQQWVMTHIIGEFGEPTGLFVTGDDAGDIYVTTRRKDGTFLFRVNGNTHTQLATTSATSGAPCTYQGKPNTGVWAMQPQPNGPASAVFVADCQTWQWDNQQSAIILRNPNPVLSNNLWGIGSATDTGATLWLFGLESAQTGGNSDLSVWQTGTWSTVNTKFAGWTGGISGTAADRVFITGNDGNQSYVLHYDGASVTQEQMPDGVSGLLGIWAAPTGELFAVGTKGAIVVKKP
jgi:hypothetical protein